MSALQVESERRDGSTVRFGDLLLTRLFLDVGPAGRTPLGSGRGRLSRGDILEHLDTVSDPEERWRQFGGLADCWREAERRQLAGLRLLAAAIGRGLVPVWAARRCLERLLGGDGETRQPPEGRMSIDDGRAFTLVWSEQTPTVMQDLQELLDLCNSDAAPKGKAPLQPTE